MDNTPLQTDAIFKVGVCNLNKLATKMKGRYPQGGSVFMVAGPISDLYVGLLWPTTIFISCGIRRNFTAA